MKIRVGRLRKLAHHLLKGKLGHPQFNFKWYNYGECINEHTGCRTMGCAMGEAPIVFPKHFTFNHNYPQLIDTTYLNTNQSGKKFFGLTSREYEHLFLPIVQNHNWGTILGNEATKEQVANNILEFCKLAQSNKLYDI